MSLQPGEEKTVRDTLPIKDLGFCGNDCHYRMEDGKLKIFAVGSSRDTLEQSLTLHFQTDSQGACRAPFSKRRPACYMADLPPQGASFMPSVFGTFRIKRLKKTGRTFILKLSWRKQVYVRIPRGCGYPYIIGSVMQVTRNKILLIAQSLLCVALVVMLAVSAIGIYRDGIAEKQENPLAWVYTREKAAAALKPILPVFLLAVGVTVACAVLNVRDENENKPVQDIELNRDLMRTRVTEPSEVMRKEQALQKKLLYGGWGGFALCMLPVLLYMTNAEHFPNGDLEQVIGAMAAHVFPWIILALACLMVSTILQEKSIRREYDAIMARIREEKAAGIQAAPKSEEPARSLHVLWWVLLAAAVVFIIIGIRNGSMTAVVNKAIRICTECVGLG